MKHTITLLAGLAMAIGLVAPANAVNIGNNTFYLPIAISGSAVTGITTSNNTGVAFSRQAGTFNNAFILAEFYASDDAKGSNEHPVIVAAPGDTLAVVVYPPYVSTVYRTLVNGRVVVSTNSYDIYDPWTGDRPWYGDIVILDARGQY